MPLEALKLELSPFNQNLQSEWPRANSIWEKLKSIIIAKKIFGAFGGAKNN